MKSIFKEKALELIKGAYDLHAHTEPSTFNRALDDIDLVREASELGMAGVLIKSHYEPTQSRAALINRKLNFSAKAFGGSVLNWPNGGLNPFAVENALKKGASIIWMPTRDSKNSLRYGDMPGDFFKRPGITIFDENNCIIKEAIEILDIVKKYNGFLATGHLSTEESIALCKLGREKGVNMILTHPEWQRTTIDGETQSYLANLGVFIEKNWLNIAEGAVTAEQMAENIRKVGVEHIYLSTDRGQHGFEKPAEGMLRFIETLLEQGFSENEIKIMVQIVPSKIVNKK